MKKNLDWVVGFWSEALSTGQDSTILPLVDEAQLLDYEDDLVVERVVGQYFLRNLTEQTQLIACRLYETDVANGGSPPWNLWSFEDADQMFMWHKIHLLDVTANFGSRNMFSAAHPEWSHIDCRVNRRLHDMKELRFHIDALTPLTVYEWGAWIRVLVKH